MSVLGDLRDEIGKYAADNMELRIISVNVPGDVLNVGEQAIFRVQIRNNGHLDAQQVRLHVEGTDYGRVSLTNGGPYTTSVLPPAVDVPALGTRIVGPLYFKAGTTVTTGISGAQELFKAHVSTYDVDFDHILRDHTGHSNPPEGAYKGEIHAS
jgi:hypothetical protein